MFVKYNRVLFSSALFALLAGNASAANASKPLPISANVAYTSDYFWRGLTQSNDNFSLQGGFDYVHESGFYLGTWAAGVEFAGSDNTVDNPRAFQELEGYGGFKGKVGTDITYNVGIIHYAYPGANNAFNYDFNEAYGSLGFTTSGLDLGLGVNYSNDFWGGSGAATFIQGTIGYKVEDTPLSVSGSLGRQNVKDNTAYGVEDYTVFGLSASYAFSDALSVSANYSKTDLSGDAGDNKFYMSASFSF